MGGDEIRMIRKAIGVNRETFGGLIGVSGRTVEKYELDTRSPGRSVVLNIKRVRMLHSRNALKLGTKYKRRVK